MARRVPPTPTSTLDDVGSSDACITLHALNYIRKRGVAHPMCVEIRMTPRVGLMALIGRFLLGERNLGDCGELDLGCVSVDE